MAASPPPADGIDRKARAKIKAAINKIWFQSCKAWKEARNRARVDKLHSRCEQCSKIYTDHASIFNHRTKRIKKVAQFHVDHIVPVGSHDDLEVYANRRWRNDPNEYQVLCLICHAEKTAREATDRAGSSAAVARRRKPFQDPARTP